MEPLEYFAFFKYVPTVPEYLRFSHLKRVPAKCQIINGRVTLPETKKYLAGTLRRQKISLSKFERRSFVLNLLGSLPMVRYLGISGTVSMLNANEKDDIDIFIITQANCLFVTRFLAVLLTSLLGVRRRRGESRAKDKLCLNLFFSEYDLRIPKRKQNLYVAHEIGQLWTVRNKENTYERFLAANRWINRYFPHFPIMSVKAKRHFVAASWAERVLRTLQLWQINCHRTTEIITPTQLWFFPVPLSVRVFYFQDISGFRLKNFPAKKKLHPQLE